jgi:hypothetical protein
MIKFPSIEQYRNVIREVRTNHDYQGKSEIGEPVYQHRRAYPKLQFRGTVKLHGTNAAIVKYKNRIEYQSRERVLSLTQDNAGFMLNMVGKNLDFLFNEIEFDESIAVFGEWCGQGIQAGVAISQVPKMFVIFAAKVDGVWIPYSRSDHSQGIFNIEEFPTWTMEIDFENPEIAQNDLVDMTNAVEQQCPVGKYFGVTGIGEGIMWATEDRRYCFKVKGEKHSSSKVKTLAEVDTELIASLNEFVDYALTESRLQQGLTKLQEMGKEVSQKSTGDYLRWIVGDIMKEEEDTIIANRFDPKKLNPIISNKARQWFFNNLPV